MYQAIVTKYHGPTNSRGSRVSATAEAGRIVVQWDYALNVEENHKAAAQALRTKLNWTEGHHGKLAGGALPQSMGGYCFVFVREEF